ncbi:MAG: hypothetical protein PVJ33_05770 [Lysobacterales bacterium]
MTDPVDKESRSPRTILLRDAAVFQLKLVADGLRDAILIPLSLVAALIGVLRGGEDCAREYHRVIKMGRRSERWINLFGQERPLGRKHPAGSMDTILETVESAVTEQYRKGKSRGASPEPGSGMDRDDSGSA